MDIPVPCLVTLSVSSLTLDSQTELDISGSNRPYFPVKAGSLSILPETKNTMTTISMRHHASLHRFIEFQYPRRNE